MSLTSRSVPSRLRALPAFVQRKGVHLLLGTRNWSDAIVREIAEECRGARILEIGSGRQDLGHDAYSVRAMFDASNTFVQSDVNPAFGHPVVDVTAMDFDSEFDVVVCLYVLEHVFDLGAAVRNIHRSLTPGGRALIAVPHTYPYHDEPIDFWRFTEHSLRALLEPFADVHIAHAGLRRMPKGLLAIATK